MSKRFKLHQFNLDVDPLLASHVQDHHYVLLTHCCSGNLIKVKETIDIIMQNNVFGYNNYWQKKVQGYQNVCKGDYDGRTALHLACSEGHYPIVEYLIESGYFQNILVKDRWQNTPLDDAIRVQNKSIEKYLRKKLKEKGTEA